MSIEERIKELLPKGLTYKQIGDELGVSRNAISGRVMRMRIRGELDVYLKPVTSRAEPEHPLERMVVAKERLTLKVTRQRCSVPAPKGVGGVHLLDLNERDCRFPIAQTDAGHFFCGEPRRDAKTRYCLNHHNIVWVKLSKRPKEERPGMVLKSHRFGDVK